MTRDTNNVSTAVAPVQPGAVRELGAQDPHTAAISANAPVTHLLQLAVERGTPVEQMEKLVDLYERMEARDAAREFNRALAAFQAECPPIGKNKEAKIATRGGGSYSYSYAPLDEIVPVVRPILQRHGLSFSWNSKVEGGQLTCTCVLRHENGHSITADFTLPTESQSAMSPQQKVGAALTFAQRKSLESVLGIVTTDKEAPENEVDPTPITEDQAVELSDLLQEVGANRAKFLAWLDASDFFAIRAADYNRAKQALEERRTAKQQKQGAKA